MADSETRKRVAKACDSCRLKKTKCNGERPCQRCKAENTICLFGSRTKFRNGVYPQGYVEMLKRQQYCLVNGLHALYKQLEVCHGWKHPPPKDLIDGEPLTHYILESLGILWESDHHEVPALLTENEDPSNGSATRISANLGFPGDSEFSNFVPTWAYELDEIKQTGQNPTPPSEDFSNSPSWAQRPGEGNLHMQLSPLQLEHGTTAQLGQQHDYFSPRMGQILDASSEYQFVVDYNGMPKQMMFSQVELE